MYSAGWYADEALNTPWDFDTDTITDDTTLYAKWTQLTLASSVSSGKIYTGGRITLTPSVDGGTWDWDDTFFSATFNSPATFTALESRNVRDHVYRGRRNHPLYRHHRGERAALHRSELYVGRRAPWVRARGAGRRTWPPAKGQGRITRQRQAAGIPPLFYCGDTCNFSENRSVSGRGMRRSCRIYKNFHPKERRMAIPIFFSIPQTRKGIKITMIVLAAAWHRNIPVFMFSSWANQKQELAETPRARF